MRLKELSISKKLWLVADCVQSWKAPISSVMSVFMYQHGYNLADLREIWGILWKYVKKIKVWLKSGKSIGRLTWRPTYVLLFLVTLNRHNSALFQWNGIRLSGSPRKYSTMRKRHNVTLYAHSLAWSQYANRPYFSKFPKPISIKSFCMFLQCFNVWLALTSLTFSSDRYAFFSCPGYTVLFANQSQQLSQWPFIVLSILLSALLFGAFYQLAAVVNQSQYCHCSSRWRPSAYNSLGCC
jgi:hypothetical protein